MIVEWVASFLLVWIVPATFSIGNPFILPITSLVLRRKPVAAATWAYCIGLLYDIVLASPRFGMLGMSLLLATLFAIGITFYFSLEGLLGSLLLVASVTTLDIFFTSFLGSFFYERFFFSWKVLLISLSFALLWATLLKGLPRILHLLTLRRHHDEDS